MKIRMGKVGLLFLVLVLALASVGVAFAAWTDTITISGTVDTGSLQIGLVEFGVGEYYEDGGIYYLGEWEGKDVGSCSWQYVVASLKTGQCGSGYGKVLVTINNAYPCYRCHMTYRIKSLDSIPVIIEDIIISDPTGELLWHTISAPAPNPDDQLLGYLYKDKNGNGSYDVGEEILSFEKVNSIGKQLHCGDSTKSEIDLHVKQPSEQNHTYAFLIEIVGKQWNESQWLN